MNFVDYKYISTRYALVLKVIGYIKVFVTTIIAYVLFFINTYFGLGLFVIALVSALLIHKIKRIKILNTEYLEISGLLKKEHIKRDDVKRVGIFFMMYYLETESGKTYYFQPKIALNPFQQIFQIQEDVRDEMYTRIKDKFEYNE